MSPGNSVRLLMKRREYTWARTYHRVVR